MNFLLKSSTSIYLIDSDGEVQCLNNAKIKQYAFYFKKFIKKFVKQPSCLGLIMDHNLYLPSIILSLKKLRLPFIFLQNDEQLSKIVNDLSIKWILSIKNIEPFKNKAEFFITKKDSLFLQFNNVNNELVERDFFCIVRTSGSTGDNKYVKVEPHCIEINAKCLIRVWNVTPTDTIYYGTALTFDPSLIELLVALISGASLVIVPKKVQINPHLLYKTLFCHQIKITVLQIVPSVFLRWSENQIKSILSSNLRVLAFGGEEFPKEILKYPHPNLRIFNLYGITEVSCWASICEIKNNDIHLGEVLHETVLELRDESGVKVKEGRGEIFIGSNTRICQIIGDDLKKFHPTGDLAEIRDNKIYYLSRKNSIVKRFGHRIDLRKIERKIENEIVLKNRLVWHLDKLLCFILIDKEVDKQRVLDKIRIKLLHSLPKEAMPEFFEIVPKIPLSLHGKIDDKTLMKLYNTEKIDREPKELFEILINKYLGLQSKKYLELNFMELGGNSILAVQLLQDFKRNLNCEYPDDLVMNFFDKSLKDCFELLNNFTPILKTNSIEEPLKTEIFTPSISMEIRWKYDFEACVDASPICFTSNKGVDLVASGSFSHIFSVLEASNGVEVCKIILPETIESTPAVSLCKSLLYVSCFDGNLYCIDLTFNKIAWTYKTGDRIKNTPQHFEGNLVFGGYDKFIHCLDCQGNLKWKTKIKGSICANLICCCKKIFAASGSGAIYCVSDVGQIIWTQDLNQPVFGTSCILNNLVVWPDVAGTLHALDFESGEKIWSLSVDNFIYSSLITKNNCIIFGCHDRNLYCVSCSNSPKILYVVPFASPISSTPCFCDNDKIISTSNCGNLKIISFCSGEVISDLSLPGEVFSTPCFSNGFVYIGCRDNFLYCIYLKHLNKF